MKQCSLGITGGIGCGKSYISAILERYGVPVYDTDSAAKRLMVSDVAIRSGIISLLGEKAYDGDVLNKPLLAGFIFSNQDNAAKINSIVHPRVHADFLRWSDSHTEAKVVGMESAILFESGFDKFVDKVLMVSAPLEVRLDRAMHRDGATREQILARINSQANDEDKILKSDFVIVNDGIADVEEQVRELVGKWA